MITVILDELKFSAERTDSWAVDMKRLIAHDLLFRLLL